MASKMLCRVFMLSSSIFLPQLLAVFDLYSITSSKFRCDCPGLCCKKSWGNTMSLQLLLWLGLGSHCKQAGDEGHNEL